MIKNYIKTLKTLQMKRFSRELLDSIASGDYLKRCERHRYQTGSVSWQAARMPTLPSLV